MMGATFSKNTSEKDASDVPSTTSTPKKLMDPRSPNMYRTPISDLPFRHSKQISKMQNLTNDDNISTFDAPTPTKLKTKLLRDLGYTMDPRSPAYNFDRTPLNFADSDLTEVSVANVSDCESNLNTPVKENHPLQYDSDYNTPVKDSSMSQCESDYKTTTDSTFSECESDYKTPIIDNSPSQSESDVTPTKEITVDSPTPEIIITPKVNIKLGEPEIDPRSPSIDIERTPLDLNIIKEQIQDIISASHIVDAVQTPTENTIVTTDSVKSFIYVDEHQSELVTPIKRPEKIDKSERQRTPLSCLINTQNADGRNTGRERIKNRTGLARSVLKESASQNSNKLQHSGSKIPILRKSISKDF